MQLGGQREQCPVKMMCILHCMTLMTMMVVPDGFGRRGDNRITLHSSIAHASHPACGGIACNEFVIVARWLGHCFYHVFDAHCWHHCIIVIAIVIQIDFRANSRLGHLIKFSVVDTCLVQSKSVCITMHIMASAVFCVVSYYEDLVSFSSYRFLLCTY